MARKREANVALDAVVAIDEAMPDQEVAIEVASLPTPTVGGVLVGLLPAINGIHGGCRVCLEHFAERANAALVEQGVPYRYIATPREPGFGTVTLESVA